MYHANLLGGLAAKTLKIPFLWAIRQSNLSPKVNKKLTMTMIRIGAKLSKINSGALFRRFTKGLKLSENRLSDQTVALLIKEYLNLAGIDSTNFSGHSLRSGFATSAAESGVEERSIMAMTGHKSTEMVRRYIKDANLFKNNALNKIKI